MSNLTDMQLGFLWSMFADLNDLDTALDNLEQIPETAVHSLLGAMLLSVIRENGYSNDRMLALCVLHNLLKSDHEEIAKLLEWRD